MPRNSALNAAQMEDFAGQGTLRHPDGGIDFDAYRQRARRAREAAIQSSMAGAWSLIASFFAGKADVTAEHQAL